MNCFIDTNIIIDLLSNKEEAEEAKERLKSLLSEENSELFVNRLVVLETLRTIHFDYKKVFREAEEKLKLFRQVEIKPSVYNEAIAFSRFCHSKGVNLKGKCEAVDFLHFMTAKHYNLAMVSNDEDFDKLEKVYIDFTSA